MIESNANFLRGLVGELIKDSIQLRRLSLGDFDEATKISSLPTDEEVSDFIYHNPLYDDELVEQLIVEGFLGYSAQTVRFSESWLEDFQLKTKDWSDSNSWRGGDEPLRVLFTDWRAETTQLWTPDNNLVIPHWAEISPSYVILAKELINAGKPLSDLGWREFEKLIGDLLEAEGWNVTVTQQTRDGGLDVVATKLDAVLGPLKSIWQAKRYGPTNKVRLREVRELSGLLESERASKAVIVTTNYLTKDAIGWIKRDEYRLDYKDKDDLSLWLSNL